MLNQRMDVFLMATPQAGVERAALVRNLASAFKKDVPTVEKMLRRARTLIKADVGPELAAKYKALIEQAGGQCELTVHGQSSAMPDAELLASEANKTAILVLEPLAAPKQDDAEQDNGNAVCYCVKCGTVIRIGQAECPKCFTPVTAFSAKNKITAGLLAFFIGGSGLHRLYLGQWWGCIYLLFWFTLIPSVVSIVEAIVFWLTPQQQWDRKYGKVQKSSSVIVLAFIASIIVTISMVGIVAAVALPAYVDYTNRAKVQSAMPLVLDAREKVASFIVRTKSYPNENILVGLPDDIQSDVIESITLKNDAKLEVAYGIAGLKDKNTIMWTPTEKSGDIVWDCKEEGAMLDRYRPRECRSGELDESVGDK